MGPKWASHFQKFKQYSHKSIVSCVGVSEINHLGWKMILHIVIYYQHYRLTTKILKKKLFALIPLQIKVAENSIVVLFKEFVALKKTIIGTKTCL